jgi:hypothetical protein
MPVDAETRDRFAIRCIVVSTQSGMATIALMHADDPARRDRLQTAILARGNRLLNEIDRAHALSPASELLMRAARAALAG